MICSIVRPYGLNGTIDRHYTMLDNIWRQPQHRGMRFAGYAHRRTLGFKEGQSKQDNEEIEGPNKTYVFMLQLRNISK